MQITRHPNESQEAFAARAFRINRELCNCNQGRVPCECSDCEPGAALPLIDPTFSATPAPRRNAEGVVIGATRWTIEEIRARGTGAYIERMHAEAISQRRGIWYGAGLMFGAALIAVAVFGMRS